MQASNQLPLALESSRETYSSFCSPSCTSGVAPVVVTPAASLPRDCALSAMSGDAWESAALHVIAKRAAPAPVPCLFPQPHVRKHTAPFSTGSTGLAPNEDDLRSDFSFSVYCFGVMGIDAPFVLPSGGLRRMRCANFSFEAPIVCREHRA